MLPLRRLTYRLYLWASGSRHWLLKRFTRAGLAVFGGAFVTLWMSFETSQKVTYQIFCLLCVLLIAARLSNLRFRLPFQATRELPPFASVGLPVTYRVRLENLSGHTQRGLLLVEGMSDPRPSMEHFIAAQIANEKRHNSFRVETSKTNRAKRIVNLNDTLVPTLPARGRVEVKLELTPQRRGSLRFKSLSLARTDPLGLFKSLSSLPAEQSLTVLPRRYPLRAPQLPGSLRYQQGGVAQAGSVGESEEFVALRDYRPGDPPRRIHHKSWARAGRPVVKEYQEEFFVRHALVLDTFLTTASDEVFEEAVSVAASFACTLDTQESLLDLMFVGPRAICFTAGRGLAHTEQMLEILAAVGVCYEQPFSSLRQLVVNHSAAVSGCICILIQWDEERRRLLEELRSLGIPLLALLVVDKEAAPPSDHPTALPEPRDGVKILEVGRIGEGLAQL